MKNIVNTLLFVALCLSPVYIFPSGLPQPADFFYLLWATMLFMYMAWIGNGSVSFKGFNIELSILFVFVFWVCLVSLLNSLYFQDIEILYPSLFYAFNMIVFFSFIASGVNFEDGFRRLIAVSLFSVSLVLFLFLALGFVSGAARQVAGFNNPNQLGYFSLLLGACAVVSLNSRDSVFKLVWILFVSLLGVLASASLTSLAALSFVFIGALMKFSSIFINRRIIAVLVSLVIISSMFISTGMFDHLEAQWEIRFGAIERKLENVGESRGYTRIIENPEFVIAGAGERGRWRFGAHHSHEMHSSLGTILFSYGAIGLLIFILFVAVCFMKLRLYAFVVFLSPMVYSLTHQGLRTTFFWVFISLAILYARKSGAKNNFRESLSDDAEGNL